MFKASLKLLSAFIFYVSTIVKSKGWLSYFDVSFNEEIQKFKKVVYVKVCG